MNTTEKTEDRTLAQKLSAEMPVKWKPQGTTGDKRFYICVPYVDARDVQDRLDEAVGPGNWQDEYYNLGPSVYCKIGIKIDGEWVFKSDVGKHTNIESEKGAASDAFKRAAVKWGIGRFVYDYGSLLVEAVAVPGRGGEKKYLPAIDGKTVNKQQLTDFLNRKLLSKETLNQTQAGSGPIYGDPFSDQYMNPSQYHQAMKVAIAGDKERIQKLIEFANTVQVRTDWMNDLNRAINVK